MTVMARRGAVAAARATGAVTPETPYALYDFHEGSGTVAADIMGNLADLTPASGTAATAWSGQKALTSFVGTSSTPFTSTTGVWSMAINTTLAARDTFYIYFATPTIGSRVYFYGYGGDLSLAWYAGTEYRSAANVLNVGSPMVVAITCSPTATILYVNGTQVATGEPTTGIPTMASPTTTFAGIAPDSWPAGSTIDTIRIWNVTLTPAQIAALTGSGWSYPAPYAYYDFHEGSGSVAADTLGHAGNLIPNVPASAWGSGGIIDETKGYVFGANSGAATCTEWTFSFDLTMTALPGSEKTVVSTGEPAGNNYFNILPTGRINWYPRTGATLSSATGVVTTGTHRYALTTTATGTRLFYDGVLVASNSAPLAMTNGGYFGAMSDLSDLVGVFDNLRTWQISLTDTQVAAIP